MILQKGRFFLSLIRHVIQEFQFHDDPLASRDHLIVMGSHLLPCLTTLSTIFIPNTYSKAVEHDRWQQAMQDELEALQQNHTWDIIPCPSNIKRIGWWIYWVKLKSNSSLDRYKACLVALGNRQEYCIDYDKPLHLSQRWP